MWSFNCGSRHSLWQGQPWSVLPEGNFESSKAIRIFPVLSRWVESEWKIFLSSRSEFASNYQFHIFLPKVNSRMVVIVPYLMWVNLDAVWSLPIGWWPFESRMLLSLGWAQHLCNAGFRSSLGHGWGGSSPYLGLLGKSWVSVDSVLRFRCGRRDVERSCALWKLSWFRQLPAFPLPWLLPSMPGECMARLTAGCVSP